MLTIFLLLKTDLVIFFQGSKFTFFLGFSLKKFKTCIIYQQNILGQSSNEKMRSDMENTLLTLLDKFIDQWYQDNPIKQF